MRFSVGMTVFPIALILKVKSKVVAKIRQPSNWWLAEE